MVERVGDPPAELGEPAVFGLPAEMDERVVLVGAEQALAATAGAEDQHRPGRRCRSPGLHCHRRNRQLRRLPRKVAENGAGHRRDVEGEEAFRQQAFGEFGQATTGRGKPFPISRRLDLVAEDESGARALVKKRAGRHHADGTPVAVDHDQMAETEPIEAADRDIDEVVGANRRDRRRHHLSDRR